MTPSFWLALAFYLVAGVWTVAVAWPFMRDTRRAAVASLARTEEVAELFREILRHVKGWREAAPPERVEKLLASVEKLAGPKIHRSDGIRQDAVSAAAPPLPTGPGELGEPPEFGE